MIHLPVIRYLGLGEAWIYSAAQGNVEVEEEVMLAGGHNKAGSRGEVADSNCMDTVHQVVGIVVAELCDATLPVPWILQSSIPERLEPRSSTCALLQP